MVEAIVGLLGTACFAVFGWAAHLSSRVTVIETQRDDLTVLINTKFEEVNRRLGRIESAMNGHLKGID